MSKKKAAILSLLIVGLGQIYADHFWRGVIWFFGAVLIIGAFAIFFGIGGLVVAPIIWIGATWDAYNIAKRDALGRNRT